MLLKFSCGNFLSYDKVQTLDLSAGRLRTKKNHIHSVRNVGNVLKFAAIYGANSSGKSNLFKAMNVMRGFVLTGQLPGDFSSVYCKIKDSNKNKPAFFEMTIILDESAYIYGMSVDLQNGLVQSEWLYNLKNENKNLLYKKDSIESDIEFGDVLLKSKEISLLAEIFQGGESPFLFSVNQNTSSFYAKNPEAEILRKIFLWFSDSLEVIYPDQSLNDSALLEETDGFQKYAEYLKLFGTGIEEIITEETTEDKVRSFITPKERFYMDRQMNLIRKLNANGDRKARWNAIVRTRANVFTIQMNEKNDVTCNVLKFVHKYGNEKVAFEMRRESDGTYRLFQLLDVLFTKENKVFVIDEISRCMHPLLTISFILNFLDMAEKRNVQLIVTTHETRLMTHDFLRRDEVWTSQKNSEGASVLNSFENEKLRIDKVMDNEYLSGALGGVPIFQESIRP